MDITERQRNNRIRQLEKNLKSVEQIERELNKTLKEIKDDYNKELLTLKEGSND